MAQLNLPALLPWQKEVFDDPSRFKVLAVGRRAGKSHLGVIMAFILAFQGKQGFWLAPSYAQAKVGWRLLKRLVLGANQASQKMYGQHLFAVNETEKTITVKNGEGWIQIRTGDNPDLLRGEGLDFVIIDECAFVKESIWTEVIRPALADKNGIALLISTPRGKNWFYRLFMRGQSDSYPGWKSWQLPTSVNPHISPDEIALAEAELPIEKFNQEFNAQFNEGGFTVFTNFRNCLTATPVHSVERFNTTVFGIDWARHEDFTVITVIDTTQDIPTIIHIERFNKMKYDVQLKIINDLIDRYHPWLVIAESNSMGDVLCDELIKQSHSFPVQKFNTSNATKGNIIQRLKKAFESEQIAIPYHPGLLTELEIFEEGYSPTGMTTYSAPAGHHDDMVMSLAFAYFAATSGKDLPTLQTINRHELGL